MRTLLIDDERDFLDGREYTVFRSSWEAIEHFQNEDESIADISYDEVWLDFSLSGSDCVDEFAKFARHAAVIGTPLKVGKFIIHTNSWGGANMLKGILEGAGYKTVRFDPAFQNPKVIGSILS